jgi:hypothetical protein
MKTGIIRTLKITVIGLAIAVSLMVGGSIKARQTAYSGIDSGSQQVLLAGGDGQESHGGHGGGGGGGGKGGHG